MRMSEAEFERQYAKATRRGEERLRTEPLATAVRFNRHRRCAIITLNKGTTLSVPVDLLEELQGATLKDLSQVEILGPGFDIEWPTLDQHFHVMDLLNGVFGSMAWMTRLARQTTRTKPKALPALSAPRGKKVVAPRKRSAVSA